MKYINAFFALTMFATIVYFKTRVKNELEADRRTGTLSKRIATYANKKT